MHLAEPMAPASADSDTYLAYRKSAGDEPLPGYVLIEPLGRGGFGEVWKCEAPGGLLKAVKFVAGANNSDSGTAHQFDQEFEAFLQIKAIRHPFLLTLERVELIDGDLVMVMELADRQMRDRYDECRDGGLPGIPREELVSYFSEAAEALDLINADYGLQHLDVKPANLFITSGHVKVGDYGLVSRLDGKMDAGSARGLTPKYVAPEVLRGNVDPRSDQYSLALVYQEMLTGTFPYTGRTPQQMMLAHVTATPNLNPLPECDRAIVARALSKSPEQRFDSCLDFVRELIVADYTPPAGTRSGTIRTSGVTQFRHRSVETTPGPAERTGRHVAPNSGTVPAPPRSHSGEVTRNQPNKTLPPLSTPSHVLPQLVPAGRWPTHQAPAPLAPVPASPLVDGDLPLAEPAVVRRVRVSPIRSVVPTGRLLGQSVPDAMPSARDFASAVVLSAAAGGQLPQLPGDIGRLADGSWACQFPTTVPESVAALKLTFIRDQWSMTMGPPESGAIVFRKAASGGGLWGAFSGRKTSGIELTVRCLTSGKSIGEVTALGRIYGTPDREFLQAAQSAVPKMIDDTRRQLGNVADRRKSPRVAVDCLVTVYPLHSDGTVEPAVRGRCRDVSTGGLAFTTADAIATRYAYVEFEGVLATSGLAVLVKLIRSQSLMPAPGHVHAGPYRLDL